VVNLVDVFVEWAPVEQTMEPIMPGILQDKENSNLVGNSCPCWEGNIGRHAEIFAHGVEKPITSVSIIVARNSWDRDLRTRSEEAQR